LQAAQKDLRGEAREKSITGGVLSRYAVARRLSATKHMSLFQQPAREENNEVSLIVVNWNGERFLKDCLGALSGQSYGNREIILVSITKNRTVCREAKRFHRHYFGVDFFVLINK
jgi:hypothetical protein